MANVCAKPPYMRPLWLAFAVYAAGGGSALAARESQPAGPQAMLTELRNLSAELEYDRVVSLGRRLLLRGDLADDQRVEGLWLLGSALVIVADTSAPDVFDELLRLRPAFEAPAGTERKVAIAFADAQKRIRAQGDARRGAAVRDMVIESPEIAAINAGDPLVLEFAIRDPNRVVSGAAVKYRLATSAEFLSLTLTPPVAGSDRWSGQVPGEVTAGKGGGDLQWFLTTTDAAGEPLIGVANAMAPRSVHIAKVASSDSRPFYKTWWFWTAVGVGAAAATTTAILVSRSSDGASVPDSDLGAVELR